jgi:hypothetical protein
VRRVASRRQSGRNHTRGMPAEYELHAGSTMRRIFIGVAGVCLALQPVHAGERKHGASVGAQAHATHAIAFATPARSNLSADVPQSSHHPVTRLREASAWQPRGEGQRTEVAPRPVNFGRKSEAGVGNAGRGEFSFVPVSPLGTEARGPRSEVGSAKRGPSTLPRERKSMTFFRLDPKFGDVSVQPVVGGVNGAQVSLGF